MSEKIIKTTESNIGKHATYYYYNLIEDLTNSFEDELPTGVKLLETFDSLDIKSRAKKAAKEASKEADKKDAANKSDDKTADKSVDKPADKTTDKSTNKSANKDANKQADKSTNKDASKSTGKTTNEPADKSADTESATDKSADKAVDIRTPDKHVILLHFENTEFVQMMNAVRRKLVEELNVMDQDEISGMTAQMPVLPTGISATEKSAIILLEQFKWLADVVSKQNNTDDMPECAINLIYRTIIQDNIPPTSKLFTCVYDDNMMIKGRFTQELSKFKSFDMVISSVYNIYILFLKCIVNKMTKRAWFMRGVMNKNMVSAELFSGGADISLVKYLVNEIRVVEKKPKPTSEEPDDG